MSQCFQLHSRVSGNLVLSGYLNFHLLQKIKKYIHTELLEDVSGKEGKEGSEVGGKTAFLTIIPEILNINH